MVICGWGADQLLFLEAEWLTKANDIDLRDTAEKA